MKQFPEGLQKTWAHGGSPSDARDEPVFMDQVREDLLDKVDVDPDRLFVSGFSQGGSMAWDLACHRADDYTASAPASGAFWQPLPPQCSGSVHLRHTHGTEDTTVPMAGRPIGSFHQGDVDESFAVMVQENQCQPETDVAKEGPESCQQWTCANGTLQLCTYDGKHSKPSGWNERVLGFLETVRPPN